MECRSVTGSGVSIFCILVLHQHILSLWNTYLISFSIMTAKLVLIMIIISIWSSLIPNVAMVTCSCTFYHIPMESMPQIEFYHPAAHKILYIWAHGGLGGGGGGWILKPFLVMSVQGLKHSLYSIIYHSFKMPGTVNTNWIIAVGPLVSNLCVPDPHTCDSISQALPFCTYILGIIKDRR